ncbi:MAG: 2,3,4,5-tetrahydropyridine-2,6-dicarboxylate N-succinyltransferase, partial [Burkholderiaceae bacterium]
MNLEAIINDAHEQRATITPSSASPEVRAAVERVIEQLDAGTLRVAEKRGGEWVVHQWIKKAVLLSFRLNDNAPVQ